ncbi:OmpH family outer membrane protein [candidate division KSB1 bacterium]
MKRLPVYMIMVAAFLFAAYFTFSGFSYQSQLSIAYVNSERIFGEYTEFIEAGKTIETERVKYETEFQGMQESFNTKRDEFEQQQLLMSEERKAALTDELNTLYQQINEYGQMHFGQEGTLAQLTAELTEPIIEKVRLRIEEVSEASGYDYVFDSISDFILYAKPDFDITDIILEELGK